MRWMLLGAGGAVLLVVLIVLVAAPSGKAPVVNSPTPAPPPTVVRTTAPPKKGPSASEALAEQARIEKEMAQKTEQEKRAQVFRFMMEVKELIPKTASDPQRREEALRMIAAIEKELGGETPETKKLREEIKRLGSDGGARPFLVGHWKFDEISGSQAKDSGPNGTHGALSGSTSWVTGRVGGGIKLTRGGHVKVPALGVFRDLQKRTYSIAVWFRPEGTPVDVDGKKNTGSYAILIRRGAHLGLRYTAESVFEASHWLDGNLWQGARSPNAHSRGRFYHLVQTVDPGAGELRLYVNGKEATLKKWEKGKPAKDYGVSDWIVGANQLESPKWNWFCEGIVDDLRLYSTALTPAQVEAIYRAAP